VRNAPNVAAKAFLPIACRPTAAPSIPCSPMNISKNRSGAAFWKSSVCVEFDTSPSNVTTSGRAASAARASPNAFLVATSSSYAGTFTVAGLVCDNSTDSGLAGVMVIDRCPPSSSIALAASSSLSALPCHPSALARKDTPWPFSVRATMKVGWPDSSASP
jgi:hypothetical protein